MKVKFKLIKSIVSLSIVAVLMATVVFAYSSMSHAWYSRNETGTATGEEIHVLTPSNMSTIDCYSLHFDGVYNAICEEITDNNNVIAMSEYDKIFLDRNVNTPLILRLSVAGVPGDENGSIKINIPCTSGYKENGKIVAYLSNVAKMYVGCGLYNSSTQEVDLQDEYTPVATTTSREEDNVAIFEGVRDAVRKTETYDEGLFIDRENGTKSGCVTIVLDYSNYADFIYTAPISQNSEELTNCLVFYIVFDYDDDLIDDFINSHDALDSVVSFVSDIGTIFVEEGDR